MLSKWYELWVSVSSFPNEATWQHYIYIYGVGGGQTEVDQPLAKETALV